MFYILVLTKEIGVTFLPNANYLTDETFFKELVVCFFGDFMALTFFALAISCCRSLSFSSSNIFAIRRFTRSLLAITERKGDSETTPSETAMSSPPWLALLQGAGLNVALLGDFFGEEVVRFSNVSPQSTLSLVGSSSIPGCLLSLFSLASSSSQ